MENTYSKVQVECAENIKNYSECINKYPQNWNFKCMQQRKELTICAEEHVADIKRVKEGCKDQISGFNLCMESNRQDPYLCAEQMNKLYDCHKMIMNEK